MSSADPPSLDDATICHRLADVRRTLAGERGQAKFAQLLGLSPSTWTNYEKTRVPPPRVLLRVSERAGVSLRWLITGEPDPTGQASPAMANPQHRAMLDRVTHLLTDRPGNAAALAAFLDLLDEKAWLEQTLSSKAPSAESGSPWPGFGRWVPVFGRAAAGLARFWRELDRAGDSQPGESALDRAIARAADLSDVPTRLAVLDMPGEAPAGRAKKRRAADAPRVRLVQLSEPVTEFQLTEFLDAPLLAERYGPMFGVRLDGDSMSPMFEHGTIVLCSPSEPARPGGPAVVRLVGQIGLTCKLYRPREAMVRLVPANDKYPAQEFPAQQLEWALAVLGSVRVE